MHKALSNFSISSLRSRVLAWIVLTVFLYSFIPSVSLAQHPTAIINTLNGTVLVNGQTQGKGTVFLVNNGEILRLGIFDFFRQ